MINVLAGKIVFVSVARLNCRPTCLVHPQTLERSRPHVLNAFNIQSETCHHGGGSVKLFEVIFNNAVTKCLLNW